MYRTVRTLRPFIVAVMAALVTSLCAVTPEKKPTGNWRQAFMQIIPSLNCVLGRSSCTRSEIHAARVKVAAYIAAFGTLAVSLGMRYYMKGPKPADKKILKGMETGSVFKPGAGREETGREEERYTPKRWVEPITKQDISVERVESQETPRYESEEVFETSYQGR